MIPILLQAHTRSLTKVLYNRDGDLLVTAAKDPIVNVWFSHNGERLGSLNGHSGTVWCLSLSGDSRRCVSGSADNTAKIWDLEGGRLVRTVETATAVRALELAQGMDPNLLALVTDATMGKPSELLIYDLRDYSLVKRQPFETGKRATVIGWSDCNRNLVTGHEDGSVHLWDAASLGKPVASAPSNTHQEAIRDLQFSADRTFFITASKDCTARLFTSDTLRPLKCYRTERPVNSASISPIRPEVCIAGGQEAIAVTTTSSRAGQFEARFFHSVFELEMGRVRGHFGPINTLAYRPDGRGYASGAEDGYVRLHEFDADYFKFRGVGEDFEKIL